MVLVFDTETNGKILNFRVPMTQVDNFPRITQIGMALYEDDGELYSALSYLIRPDGWEIPKEKFFIDNNMSTERCQNEGVNIQDALIEFCSLISKADVLVAHNIDFDYPVIGAEMIRLGIKASKKLPKVCTMRASKDYCKLPGKQGFKFPKLEELHIKLFGTMPEDLAHDELGDVYTTAKCFFELKRLNVISLKN